MPAHLDPTVQNHLHHLGIAPEVMECDPDFADTAGPRLGAGMKHLKITVIGKVQGVFFRATARDEARKLGLSGFARNEPDGSVYIEAEGPAAALEQFLAWCHRGSRGAVVENVSHTEHAPVGHQGFETY